MRMGWRDCRHAPDSSTCPPLLDPEASHPPHANTPACAASPPVHVTLPSVCHVPTGGPRCGEAQAATTTVRVS